MSKNERALEALTGLPVINGVAEFPDSFDVPEVIHAETLSAIKDTHQDGRERKNGFRYKDGIWAAGKTKTGRGLELRQDGTSREARAGRTLVIFRPHIFMHTHPSVDPTRTEASVRRWAEVNGMDEEWISERIPIELEHESGTHMLPSRGDIFQTYSNSLGSVGNLIASTGGLFLYLRRNLKQDELLEPTADPNVADALEEYHAAQIVTLEDRDSAAFTKYFVCRAAATALGHRYLCYFGEDPENPRVTKVEEFDISPGTE